MASQLLEQLRSARLHLQRQGTDVDGVVGDNLGLHSTDYWSPYVSAWARLPALDAAALYRRLNSGRGLVRINCFRTTVHLVRVEDLPLLVAATGEAAATIGRRSPTLRSLSGTEVRAGLDRVCAALADGPRGTNELKAALPDLAANLRDWLRTAMGEGEVIRADAPHARSNRSRYALTRAWVPGYAGPDRPPADARAEVLRRAVHAFGPLTEADLAWWLPATRAEVKRALASMGTAAAHLDVDGTRYWYATPLADVPAPPRAEQGAWLLPYEDGLLKGYQERAWCLEPGLKDVLFPYNIPHYYPPDGVGPPPGPKGGVNNSGEARPSIWWGGRAVGRWEERDGNVLFRIHADVGADATRAIEAELARLEAFLATELGPIS